MKIYVQFSSFCEHRKMNNKNENLRSIFIFSSEQRKMKKKSVFNFHFFQEIEE